jgi:signal transduction histidine kinase
VVFGIAAVAATSNELRSSLDRALQQRARDVGRLSVSAPAVLTAPGALEAPVGGRQIVVEVIDGHGRILARSLALGARLLPTSGAGRAALRGGRPGFEDLRVGGRPLRLYAAPVADAGGSAAGGVVLVASDTSDISATLGRLRRIVALAALLAVLLAGAAAAAFTRRGLRPLARLSESARDIERSGDASRRLPESRAAEEITDLTRVLNGMLGALDNARDSERRFLADASHELRTPVTALLGNVEHASRHGADAGLLAELRHDATRLARLVDDLLALERQRGSAPPSQPVALDELAAAVANVKPLVKLGRVERTSVAGDAEALKRAIANLVDNALLHGPAGQPVDIAVRASDDRAFVTVADRGGGPSPAEREHLFERFWRGDAAAGRPGSGLGLPIVAAIAAAHGGRVTVEGSSFTLDLPLRDDPERR